MEVRRLTIADLDACFACRLRALENAPTAFVTSLDEDRTRGPERFAKILGDQGDDRVIFGAISDGSIFGTAGVHCGDRAKTRHKATISGMYVDAVQRRKGIGGRLLDLALDHARQKMKSAVVHLSLEAENDAARELYVSRGFVVWGTEPQATFANGRFHNELHMVLVLRG